MAEAGEGGQERYAPAMQRALVPCSLVILASTLFAPAAAEASELRYSNTVKGGIVSTGNTLGLAKELNANGPGTRDSIGTFLTLDNQLVDNNPANVNNPWGPGTTGDWTLDGSAAVLELPMASGAAVEVLYAELIWETRKKRAMATISDQRREMDWVVVRNRTGHVEARNMRRLDGALGELSKRVGFRTVNGLSERVIYRELFPSGLTLLDKGHLGELGTSHLVARQEMRSLLAGLHLNMPDNNSAPQLELA